MSKRLLKFTFTGTPIRADKFLAKKLKEEGISREVIQKLIKSGKLKVSSQIIKKSSYLLEGEKEIEIELDYDFLPPLEIEAEEVPLEIIWEDDHLIVVNKPRGIVVHPASGNWKGTLLSGLLYKNKKLAPSENLRPGIVHRLDKVTSGLLLVAKTTQALTLLSEQFRERKIQKEYHALCEGRLPSSKGRVDVPLKSSPQERKIRPDKSGKEAITEFEVKKYFPATDLSYVYLYPKTGRTHQLRVHMSFIGNPILGDKLYGAKKEFSSEGVALHAYKISFYHPHTKKEMEFSAPEPEDMKGLLRDS